jgi:hypothetical protein
MCALLAAVHIVTGSAKADNVNNCLTAAGARDLTRGGSLHAIDVCAEALKSATAATDRALIHARVGCRYFLLGDTDRAVSEWAAARREDPAIPANLLGTRAKGCTF